jgi:hypothetical protein
LDRKDLGNQGEVIFATKRMNLGKGMTEDDPEFSAHLDGKWSNHYPGYLSEGSICSAFEGQDSS